MFGNKKEKNSDFEILTIYDSKTRIYDRPMFTNSKEDFLRDFLNFMSDPAEQRSKIVLNAEDYSVFKIGTYDKGTGHIELLPTLEHVVNMHDLRAQAQAKGIVST